MRQENYWSYFAFSYNMIGGRQNISSSAFAS